MLTTTFTLLRIVVVTAQKSKTEPGCVYTALEQNCLKTSLFLSDMTTLSKRSLTKTERYALSFKQQIVNISLHFRYQLSLIRTALCRIIENGDYFMFWKAFND